VNVGVRGRQFLTPGAYQACVYVSLLTRVCVVYMLVCTYACMGVRGRQEKEGGGGRWSAQVRVPCENVCLLVL